MPGKTAWQPSVASPHFLPYLLPEQEEEGVGGEQQQGEEVVKLLLFLVE